MDTYTEETRAWLDRRFRETSPDGVYVAHQPIYGFDAGHCEPSLLPRYVRTLEIMRALARLRFGSCLDVGAAEGYKAELVRRLFGAEVVASDLAESACERARQIFGLTAGPVTCMTCPSRTASSTWRSAVRRSSTFPTSGLALSELLRVSRTAVVITVPHESAGARRGEPQLGEPHAHINSFQLDSLDFLEREAGARVIAHPIVSPLTAAASGLVEGARRELREPAERHRSWNRLARVNNAIAPVTARLFGARAESALLELDPLACRRLRVHRALLFVVLKDPTAWSERPARKVSASEIVSFRVPFHYPA